MRHFEYCHNLRFLILIVVITFLIFPSLEIKAQQAQEIFQSYSNGPYLNFTYFVDSASLKSSSNCTFDNPCLSLKQIFSRLNDDLSNNNKFILSSVKRIVAVEILFMSDYLTDCSYPATIQRLPITDLGYYLKFSSQSKQWKVKCKGIFLDLLNVNRKDIELLYFENLGIENVKIFSTYAKNFLLSNVKLDSVLPTFDTLDRFILEYSVLNIFQFKVLNHVFVSRISNCKISSFTMNIIIGSPQDEFYISNIRVGGSFSIYTEQLSIFSLFDSQFEEFLASFSLSNVGMVWIENCQFVISLVRDPIFLLSKTEMIKFYRNRIVNGGVVMIIKISDSVDFRESEISYSNLGTDSNIDNEFLLSYQAAVSMFSVETLDVANCKFAYNRGDRASSLYLSEVSRFLMKQTNFTQGFGSAIYIDAISKTTKALHSSIENCLFQDNYSPNMGGAIFVAAVKLFSIQNTIFRNNVAKISGGAILLYGATDSSFTGSQFYGNRVEYNDSLPTDKYYMGNGGAVSFLTSFGIIAQQVQNVTFESNSALNGGAIFYVRNTLKMIKDCTFKENRAQRAGGAVYQYQSSELSLDNINFIENKAIIYGDDYFSSENSLTLNQTNYGLYNLYPGQNIFVGAMATSLKKIIPVNVDNVFVRVTNPYHSVIVNALQDGINITMLSTFLNKGTSNTRFNITLGWAKYELKAENSLTIQVIDCPTDTELVLTNVPSVGYSCFPKDKLPLGLILGIAIPSSILFFILGIISASIIIYIAMKILKRLKKLSRKEKAEKSIAQKILDKRVIFGNNTNTSGPLSTYYTGSLTSPLLSQNEMEMKMKSRLDAIIINIEDLEIVKKISEGGQGTVYKAILFKKTSVAVKSLKNLADDEELQLEFEKEASILASLQHANILKFYGVCITDETRYMVTEFLENGSLERLIFNCRTGKTNLTFQQKILILQDISAGMDYLHSLEPAIIHRDLKPGNVLLDDNMRCKICDFGLSRSVGNLTQNTMTRGIGTLFYASPELMKNQDELSSERLEISHETKISRATKTDVYSFGIIMWELFFELTPYTVSEKVGSNSSLAPVNVLGMVLEGYRPQIPFESYEELLAWLKNNPVSNINNAAILEYFSLTKQCWNQDPDVRPSFANIRSELLKIMSTCNSRSK